MKTRYNLTGAASIALFAMLAMPASAQQPKPQYGGQLIYAQSGEEFSLFLGRNLDSGAGCLAVCLRDAGRMSPMNEINPRLAKSWTISADGKVTFELQEGVKFHDGTPFNAEAVAFVFNEATAKKFIYRPPPRRLRARHRRLRILGVAPLHAPFAALLPTLAYRPLCMFSPTAYKAVGEPGLATQVVGTGPFAHPQFVKGEYTLFEKNTNYWQKGKPYSTASSIVSYLTRRRASRCWRAARSTAPPAWRLRHSAARAQDKSVAVADGAERAAVLRRAQPHGSAARRSARCAGAQLRRSTRPASCRACSPAAAPPCRKAPTLSPGVFGFADMREPGEDTIFPYDLGRARALLKEAGYEDRNGDGFVEDAQGNNAVAQALHAARRDQGRLSDRAADPDLPRRRSASRPSSPVLESAAFSAARICRTERREIRHGATVLGHPDGGSRRADDVFTHTKAWKPVGANRMFFSNAEIGQAGRCWLMSEIDPAKRNDMCKQWMARLLRPAPVIYLPTLARSGRPHLSQGRRDPVGRQLSGAFRLVRQGEMRAPGRPTRPARRE